MTAHEIDRPQFSHNERRAVWARGEDGSNVRAPDTMMTDEISAFSLAAGLWSREVVSRGLGQVRTVSWATEVRELPRGEYNARHPGQSEALLIELGGTGGPCVTRLHLSDGHVHAWVAARDVPTVEATLSDLRGRLPVAEVDPEVPRVPVTFWSLSQLGPTARTRQISVPAWVDIDQNYNDEVTGGLLDLIGVDGNGKGFQPGVGGQLLLWHGPPGTGKTYALRALAWEWRAWADLHYITDPEVFFGDRASYMLDVLLHDHDDPPIAAASGGGDEPEPEQPRVDSRAALGRWKLLVLEDTGELMSADARDRSGQGLSRLLNVVDGLIGQGLRVLVLVTTNEELTTLHPAVQRPGRCASKVLFGALDYAAARRWLVDQGVDADEAHDRVTSAKPVADLFAMLEERETTADRGRAPVGFVS